MFLSCSKVYVFVSRPCFKSMARFQVVGYIFVSRPCFNIHISISNPSFRSRGYFSSSFLIYFKVYYLFITLCVSVSLCFINSIYSKNIHPKIKSSFCRFLCFMSCIFNMCHIFIGSTSSIFMFLGCF